MDGRLLVLLLLLPACSGEKAPAATENPPGPAPKAGPEEGRPQRVVFEHILISFEGAHELVETLRPREEAERLAKSVHSRARSGIDFEKLKQRFSDDRSKKTGRALGPYTLVDFDLPYDPGEIPLSHYSKRSGFLLFRMKVGDIALAEYHPEDCPFGWQILKRIE